MDMNKVASSVVSEGYQLGVDLYAIYKQAMAGDPEAIQFVNEAMKAAEGEMAAGGAPMGGAPAGAPMGGAPMEPPAQPGPTIVCPQCGNEVTPTPEGFCPVCGFDFNALAAAASAPAEQGAGAAPAQPTQEEVAGAAEGIKQAAINDPNVAAWLMQHYGNRI